MSQKILIGNGDFSAIKQIIAEYNIGSIFLICDGAFQYLPISSYIDNLKINMPVATFTDFKPNPLIEQVHNGVLLFEQLKYDSILAIGGGSTLDVAKCIRYMAKTDTYIPLIATPTTAGTGSESTKFVVVYKDGQKQSIENESILPDVVILESSLISTLPNYQRKATMLDALCHSIESTWAVGATDESREYAKQALNLIITAKGDYLANTENGNKNMLIAANFAGRAINISKTTTAHAMSYKLTSLYGIAHGHAAAICLMELWKYMLSRNKDLRQIFNQKDFRDIVLSLELPFPHLSSFEELDILVHSVNQQRNQNNPVDMDEYAIREVYEAIFNNGDYKQ